MAAQVVNVTVPSPLWVQIAAADPNDGLAPHATVLQVRLPSLAATRHQNVSPCMAACKHAIHACALALAH